MLAELTSLISTIDTLMRVVERLAAHEPKVDRDQLAKDLADIKRRRREAEETLRRRGGP